MGRRLALFAVVLLFALTACATTEKTPTEGIGIDHAYIVFHYPEEPLGIRVEIADTNEEQVLGLMDHTYLADYAGMLFVFEQPLQGGFWMKDMDFPIDIVFIDKNWKIVGMHTWVMPCTADPCDHYYSEQDNIMYVLEVNAGFMQKHGISNGHDLLFLA